MLLSMLIMHGYNDFRGKSNDFINNRIVSILSDKLLTFKKIKMPLKEYYLASQSIRYNTKQQYITKHITI